MHNNIEEIKKETGQIRKVIQDCYNYTYNQGYNYNLKSDKINQDLHKYNVLIKGKYFTGEITSPELVFAALLQISQQNDISLAQAANKIHIEKVQGDVFKDPFYNAEKSEVVKEFANPVSSLARSLKYLQDEKRPTYISMEEGGVLSTMALIPNPDNVKEISLVHVISHYSDRQKPASSEQGLIGLKYVEEFLKFHKCTIKESKVIYPAQHNNKSGLNVSTNIAKLYNHFENGKSLDTIEESSFAFKDEAQEKKQHAKLGESLFTRLRKVLTLNQGSKINYYLDLYSKPSDNLEAKINKLIKRPAYSQEMLKVIKGALDNSDISQDKQNECYAQIEAAITGYKESYTKLGLTEKIIDILLSIFGKDLYRAQVINEIDSVVEKHFGGKTNEK